MRRGAEIKIENTRKNRQARVDAGVRLRASHQRYSMQESDSMHVCGGKGLRRETGRDSAEARAFPDQVQPWPNTTKAQP